jgi:hypothetical protein
MDHFAFSSEERKASGFTDRFVVTHEDLTQATANTAQAVTLLALVAGMMIGKVATRVVTPFTDASDAAFNATTLTIGDTGSANRFLSSQELNSNGTEVLAKAGTNTLNAYNAGDTLLATFGSMTGKALADIDAGEVHIFAEVIDLRKLAGA